MPPRARSVRTRGYALTHLAPTPQMHELLGTTMTTLFDYKSSTVADTIRALKYDASPYAAKLCADALADYLMEEIASAQLYSTRPIIIVPVPLHTSRERERGYNQIAHVLRHLPPQLHTGEIAHTDPHFLLRNRPTPPQTRLSRRERLTNVSSAFSISNPHLAHGTHIFLIDDVLTTGATLLHAGKPLEAAGAQVTRIALGRA